MSSGTLTSQSNFSIPSSSQDFPSLIKTLCQTYRLTVVEQIHSAASLYAETILEHPIALLVKSTVCFFEIISGILFLSLS